MSTGEEQKVSTYGLACGSTELGKTRNIFLAVSAGCVYAIIGFFRFIIYMFQGKEAPCIGYAELLMNFVLDTFIAFLKVYIIGLLPIIALRKVLIQESVRRNTSKCLLDELRVLMYKKRTYIIPLIYMISSIIIGWTYFDLIGASYKRTRAMFLYPGTEDFWCPSHRKDNCKSLPPMINEHYLIALIHTTILGIWYGFDFLLRKRYMLPFHIIEPRYPFSLAKELMIFWNRKYEIFIWSTLMTALSFSIISWFIKLFIWNTIYELLPNLIFLHNTAVYHWMRASWFDVQLFNRTVQLAFLELWHIAKFDQYRRSAIYTDFNRKQAFSCIKHNNPTDAWTEISRSCMDLIFGLANSAQDEIKEQQTRKSLVRKKYDMFRNMEKDALKEKERKRVGHKNLEVKMTAETMTKDRDYWEMKLLEWFHPVKDLNITICAIQALTALTVKSLNEDKHGIVQNDTASVFEAMLDCLISLERYSNEPPLDEWDVGDPFAFTYSRVLSDPLIVINVLKDSLFDLEKAFYQHMDFVKLSSIHFDRLNKLLIERI
ncbi:4165_t:CDS:10 [Funneliformis mosseae]|uniref:4165_t:CDS:1 n=1 Tax=Funneliformis mosseae TaxID=27381 RepID=A0A9N8ZGQ8_FUNMO|nr:4165_t:CDS:10 [Funneliformis mosseae]